MTHCKKTNQTFCSPQIFWPPENLGLGCTIVRESDQRQARPQ